MEKTGPSELELPWGLWTACMGANLGVAAALISQKLGYTYQSDLFALSIWVLPIVSVLLPWLGVRADLVGGRSGFAALATVGLGLLLALDGLTGFPLSATALILVSEVFAIIGMCFLISILGKAGPLAKIRLPGMGLALGFTLFAVLFIFVYVVPQPMSYLAWAAPLCGLASMLVTALFFHTFRGPSGFGRPLFDGDRTELRRETFTRLGTLFEKNTELPELRIFFVAIILLSAGYANLFRHLFDKADAPDLSQLSWNLLGMVALAVWGAAVNVHFNRTIGGKRTLVLSTILAMVMVGGLALARSDFEADVLLVLTGFLVGLTVATVMSLTVRFSPVAQTGQMCGMLFAAVGLGWLLHLVPGFWEQTWSFHPLTALASLLPAVILLQYVNRDRALQQAGEELRSSSSSLALERAASRLQGLAQHHAISRFMQYLARSLAEIFFGRLTIRGAENAVSQGAIVVANHPNTFLDALLITAVWPGRLHYWAKATLWKRPVIGAVLDYLGGIPIFRRQDLPQGATADNSGSMTAAREKLLQSAQILIFPEGVSREGLTLNPIKTGAARLGFESLEHKQWEGDLPIVPIGIDYAEPKLFRTSVTITIGKPIWLKDYKAEYQSEPRQTVRLITDQIARDLGAMIPNLDEPQLESLVVDIQTLYGEKLQEIIGESDEHAARKKVVEAVNHYHRLDPAAVYRFAERMAIYFQETKRLGTPENHPPIPFRDLFKVFKALFSFVTFGIIGNWLPYRMTGSIVERLSPSPTWMATAKLGVGSFVFGLYYLAVGLLCYFGLGALFALVVWITLVISGFLALGSLERYAFRVRQLQTLWQAFWTQDTDADLDDMKLALMEDLEHFREAWAYYDQ